MKLNIKLSSLVLFAILTASCGTSAKRTLAIPDEHQQTVRLDQGSIEIVKDDHQQTRRNADRIFDAWSKTAHLHRNITGRRLMSIAPKDDGCHLTYDFRLTDGSQRRVTLIVRNQKVTYKKSAKDRRAEIVNGRRYELKQR